MIGHAIAVDVGGTEIKAAVVAVSEDGAYEIRQVRRRTPRGDEHRSTADAVVGVVAEVVSDLSGATEVTIDAVGIVVPGTIDEQHGVGVFSADPGWRDEPLHEKLAAHIGPPLVLGHDVHASALAEARLGAARGIRDVAVLPIGTGIAAALVLDGRAHTGGGYAGEIGHVDIGHGEPCACGTIGCMEAISSSAAIARRYTARTGKPVHGAVEVTAALRAGDPDARSVWNEAIDGLAKGLLVLCSVVAPEVIVLGGGLAQAGDLLTEPLRTRLAELLTFHRRPRIELAELGDTAGCLGAAMLAIEGRNAA